MVDIPLAVAAVAGVVVLGGVVLVQSEGTLIVLDPIVSFFIEKMLPVPLYFLVCVTHACRPALDGANKAPPNPSFLQFLTFHQPLQLN